MPEPKYKLNEKDAKRWRDLLVRHCSECPAKPEGKVKPNPKCLPLNPKENAEFEALCKKRRQKPEAHPLMKASLRHQHHCERKLQRLFKKLERLPR